MLDRRRWKCKKHGRPDEVRGLVGFEQVAIIHTFYGTALARRKLISAFDLTLGDRFCRGNAPSNERVRDSRLDR
jgi:hypothetical protein